MKNKKQVENYRTAWKTILEYYGPNAQLSQLIQELGELIVAITKQKEENFLEEIADVLVMLDQFRLSNPEYEKKIEIIKIICYC